MEVVPTLGVGMAGKRGWADLRLARVGDQTRLVHADAHVPYHVGRLHPGRSAEAALLYLTMPTGGLVQGDRLAVRAVAETGAHVRLTTPAATKVYGMAANYASQGIALTAQPGSWLEWWPEPTIPYAGARYQQVTTLTAAPGAVLVWAEVVLAGRLARGEQHAYDWLDLLLTVHDEQGATIAADRQRLRPAERPVDIAGRCRQWPALVSAYLLAPGQSLGPLYDRIGARIDALDQGDGAPVLAGVSTLQHHAGLVVRALVADSGTAASLLAAVHQAAVACLRPVWLDASPHSEHAAYCPG